MINIYKLKEFTDILESWKDIEFSNIWVNNSLLEKKINKWLKHLLFNEQWKIYKTNWNKLIEISENKIEIKEFDNIIKKKVYKSKSIIEKFIFIKEKNKYFNQDKYLFYFYKNKYKKIKVWEFKNKFISFIKVCPYCWYEKLKKWNINLDHFFPRETFPEFSYSLFNIIPSCVACNWSSYKWDKFFNETGLYFHPYFWLLNYDNWFIIKNNSIEDIDDMIDFFQKSNEKYDYEYKIWNYLEKAKKHLDFFNLEEKYINIKDDINEDFGNFIYKKLDIKYVIDKIPEKDKINYINSVLSHNNIEYPFVKEKILWIRNWKIKKDLYTSFLEELKQSWTLT